MFYICSVGRYTFWAILMNIYCETKTEISSVMSITAPGIAMTNRLFFVSFLSLFE
jgi:hypothetical protein